MSYYRIFTPTNIFAYVNGVSTFGKLWIVVIVIQNSNYNSGTEISLYKNTFYTYKMLDVIALHFNKYEVKVKDC